MKTLAELQAECAERGLTVPTNGRPSKEPYIVALREFHWNKEHAGEPLPPQIMPMLLSNWSDLDEEQADDLEQDMHNWIVQPKLDGIRTILQVDGTGQVRITTRCISEVNYRLSELQENLPHLEAGFLNLGGTILDGELVCPVSRLDTGSTTTSHPLQAAVAIISTSPENARRVQERQNAWLRFHVFDVLQVKGQDVAGLPLYQRQVHLFQAVALAKNDFVESVPSFSVGKVAVHDRLIESGGEGTVWKRVDQGYVPGKRVRHWIKRKRGLEVEGIVSGFKPGTTGKGNENLVGAVEFSSRNGDGTATPIAWVSSWTNSERQLMTDPRSNGQVSLNPKFFGRRALIAGQSESAKSARLSHARFVRWLDA